MRNKTQKPRVPAPEDLISVRADADNPGLYARFQGLMTTHGGDRAAILRALIVGYCECVERHDRLPKLPLFVESDTKRKK